MKLAWNRVEVLNKTQDVLVCDILRCDIES